MLVSVGMVFGLKRDQQLRFPFWRGIRRHSALLGLAAVALVFIVIVVDFVVGAAEGSLRILPSHVHQVSTSGLNKATWTSVSPAQFRVWEARFIREQSLLSLFGFFLVGYGLLMRRVRRLTKTFDSS